MSHIAHSFATGKKAEDHVLSLLSRAGLSAEHNHNKATRGHYDLESVFDGRPFTIEVKYDLMAARTGNVAVEHYNPRKGAPSGLSLTTADLWVFVFCPLEAFVCSTAALRAFTATAPRKEIACGGDNNAALWLYKKADILPGLFHSMDHLSGEELRGLLAHLLEETA